MVTDKHAQGQCHVNMKAEIGGDAFISQRMLKIAIDHQKLGRGMGQTPTYSPEKEHTVTPGS